MRHARAVMRVRIAYPQWRGKRSRHSRRMRIPQFYLSIKRPMLVLRAVERGPRGPLTLLLKFPSIINSSTSDSEITSIVPFITTVNGTNIIDDKIKNNKQI